LDGHSQEVCALKWNPEKNLLASGSSDCSVRVWELQQGTTGEGVSSYCSKSLDGHIAAVKAMTWVPTACNMLVTGGGTADRCIKLWNVTSSRCVKTVDTGSQVCQLSFNSHYEEVVSSHGNGSPSNMLCVWKYPFLNKIKELAGHTGRVLHMCTSPDEEIVASAADDETIRLWEVFARDTGSLKTHRPNAKKVLGNNMSARQSNAVSSSLLMMQHR